MTWSAAAPLAILGSSLLPGLAIFFLGERRHRTRTLLNLAGAGTKLALVGGMLVGVYRGGGPFAFRLPMLPGIEFLLALDALAMLFVSLSAVLWLLTTIYAIGYLENSPNRSRFFGFFSLCVSTTVGIAMAGNLFTLFFFYEMLTLSTWPLVVHRGTPEALRAGRAYLAYTLTGGGVLLVGIVWAQAMAGPITFDDTGALAAAGLPDAQLRAIFALLVGGFAVKAAMVPLHGWLPRAMVAPTPVSALLHAVAVVKAGAFGIVRVIYDVFGIEFARILGVTGPLAIAAAVTIIYGSVQALRQDDIKRRLAYSTVSQMSYIVLGTALASPVATIGGLVHLVHQGLMKITLFYCAGNIAETLGLHRIGELDGVGRRMPWTMAAFTVAALGMMGLPPMAGFISKWFLGIGAADTGQGWVLAVLIASSLLNALYFLPIINAAWFRPRPKGTPARRSEAKPSLLGPTLAVAALVVLAGTFAGSVLSPLYWVRLIAQREFP